MKILIIMKYLWIRDIKNIIVIYVFVWIDEGLDEIFFDDFRDIIYTFLIIYRNVRRVFL